MPSSSQMMLPRAYVNHIHTKIFVASELSHPVGTTTPRFINTGSRIPYPGMVPRRIEGRVPLMLWRLSFDVREKWNSTAEDEFYIYAFRDGLRHGENLAGLVRSTGCRLVQVREPAFKGHKPYGVQPSHVPPSECEFMLVQYSNSGRNGGGPGFSDVRASHLQLYKPGKVRCYTNFKTWFSVAAHGAKGEDA